MSRIYFHSETGDAEVRGWERAHFGWTCNHLLLVPLSSFLSDFDREPSVFRQIIPAGTYVLDLPDFQHAAQRWLTGMSGRLIVDGNELQAWVVALNTALLIGNDFIKLAARLHGQCEIHAYVEESNREWLAEIIRQGRAARFLRDDSGWEGLIEMLVSGSGPVVTSYSVCHQFPNPYELDWGDFEQEEYEEQWYALSQDEQWSRAMDALREKGRLEIGPDDWDSFFFGDGWDGYKLADYLSGLQEKQRTTE